jgi:hypothetical protein
MTDLFPVIPVSGRVVADRRSSSARSSRGAVYQVSRCLTSLPPDCASAIVKLGSVPVVIVGTPLHVLAVSLLIVEVFGIPSSEVPTEIMQFPHLRSQGVVASRHSPLVCRRMLELPDDKLPSHESSKGDQRYSAQRKATVVAPRILIGPAYARSVKLCFRVGLSHPLDVWLPTSCATWVAIP